MFLAEFIFKSQEFGTNEIGNESIVPPGGRTYDCILDCIRDSDGACVILKDDGNTICE